MSELLVARHAQASFRSADYDRLSPLGHHQAELLGRWLAERPEARVDAVATGTLRRHRETLDAVRAAYAARGLPLPEPVALRGLDEFDHRDVLQTFARRQPDHPDAVAAEHGATSDPRLLYRFLRAGITAWALGQLDDHVHETWAAFRARVRDGLAALDREAPGARVLVITSGGVVSQLAQCALDLPDLRAVELNLTVRNTALAEFRRLDGGLGLLTWNAVPHLAAPDRAPLLTYY